MVPLASLWLPIVVSAALVFVASSIIWMALPIHKNDYKGLPDEDAVMTAMKQQNPGPGIYYYPWCNAGRATDAASKAKSESGPWGQIVVAAGKPAMGPMLSAWIVHLLIVGVFIAYVSGLGLAPGTSYLKVFQVSGAAAMLAYGGGVLPKFIWEGKPWSLLPGAVFDAVVYALLTAGTFGWLWPKVTF